MSNARKVTVHLDIELNESNVPTDITWKSDDPPSDGKEAPAKAFFLSLFDKDQLETLKIDLWTEKFEVGEMDRMMYYTLKGLADSYHRATKKANMANDIARFAQYFGEETGILKPKK
ncbi:MAG: gliding motility protein GldC [Bacteroidota bacterium]